MVEIDSAKCIGCGQCARDCFENKIRVANGRAVADGDCFLCGHCAALCPADAIRLTAYPDDAVPYDRDRFYVNPDNLLNAIRFRRSTRRYRDEKVPRALIDRLIEAGRFTATGSNAQDVSFVVVQDGFETLKPFIWEGLERVADAFIQKGEPGRYAYRWKKMFAAHRENPENRRDGLFFEAPMLLVLTGEATNCALAAQNMELLASTLGLGCLFSGFIRRGIMHSPEAKAFLGLDGAPVSMCMLVGYPDVRYLRTAQRKAADVRYL